MIRDFTYLTPFNFRPPLIFGRGWPKIRGAEKVKLFFGWPKIKGAEIFLNPFITLKQKRIVIYRKFKGPKIKGGRKLKGVR